MISPSRSEMRRIVTAPARLISKPTRAASPEIEDFEEVLLPVGKKSLNCLRCKHCKLLPHTDMSRALDPEAVIPIRCEKLGKSRTVFLAMPCPFADPRPARQGDRQTHVGKVEAAFLAAHYRDASLQVLATLTGRTRGTITTWAQRHGIKRNPRLWGGLVSIRARRARGEVLNEAQSHEIMTCFNSGFWPSCGGATRGAAGHTRIAQDAQIREAIVERVDALGPAQQWKAILLHQCNQSPAAKRARRAKRKAR